MQLWTDETQSEYKITFDRSDVISTNPSIDYTQLIDELLFVDGYDHDWSYTLSQWVVHFLINKSSVNMPFMQKENFKTRAQNDSEVDSRISILISQQKSRKSRNKIFTKLGLKCHYCNLKYSLEGERKEHEEFWHSSKLIKV